ESNFLGEWDKSAVLPTRSVGIVLLTPLWRARRPPSVARELFDSGCTLARKRPMMVVSGMRPPAFPTVDSARPELTRSLPSPPLPTHLTWPRAPHRRGDPTSQTPPFASTVGSV